MTLEIDVEWLILLVVLLSAGIIYIILNMSKQTKDREHRINEIQERLKEIEHARQTDKEADK